MTNVQCDNILTNSLTDIFRHNKSSDTIIKELNDKLNIDQKLILLSYYLKYKFNTKPSEEIDYKTEDSLPEIINEIIKFIIHDITDNVYINKEYSKFKMLEEVVIEIYRLFKEGKHKLNKINISISKKSYNAIMQFLEEYLKQNNKENNYEK